MQSKRAATDFQVFKSNSEGTKVGKDIKNVMKGLKRLFFFLDLPAFRVSTFFDFQERHSTLCKTTSTLLSKSCKNLSGKAYLCPILIMDYNVLCSSSITMDLKTSKLFKWCVNSCKKALGVAPSHSETFVEDATVNTFFKLWIAGKNLLEPIRALLGSSISLKTSCALQRRPNSKLIWTRSG